MTQARSSFSTTGSGSSTRVRGKSVGVQSRAPSGLRTDETQMFSSGAALITNPVAKNVSAAGDSQSNGIMELATVQPPDNSVTQIREGYDYASIVELANAFDATMEATISVLGLPRSTIKKKQMEAQPLSPGISDQIYRANRVFARCMDLFSEKEAANRWLQREHRSLHGATPLSLLDTTAGYEMVLDELERINNGVPV